MDKWMVVVRTAAGAVKTAWFSGFNRWNLDAAVAKWAGSGATVLTVARAA